MRRVYRHPILETVLLLAVLVQIISGLKLFRSKIMRAPVGFGRLQAWAGLYLAIFLVIHLSAVLGGRFFLHLDTNIYFGVAGLNTFPFNLFFIPYYGLALLSFFAHLAAIHRAKMQQSIFGLSPRLQAISILVIGLFWTLAIFYGLTNHFRGMPIPKEYEVLIRK